MASKQTTQQQPQPAKSKAQPKPKQGAGVPEPSFFHKCIAYFQSAQVELGKVSWPTAKEVKVTGYAVAALVTVMAIYLGLVDALLAWITEAILSIGV